MARGHVTTIRGIEILFVCTGNVCRSPTAEALLRRRLDEQSIEAQVGSAGLIGEGDPATEAAAEVARDLGVDLSEHRSRLLSEELIRRSDLVIGLAREHVREVVVQVPEAFPRTFTLKELVRRGRDVGPRRPDEVLADWLDRVHEGRDNMVHLGSSRDDDVEDPIGRRPAVYERVGDEIDRLVDGLVALAWPADDAVPPADPELAIT